MSSRPLLVLWLLFSAIFGLLVLHLCSFVAPLFLFDASRTSSRHWLASKVRILLWITPLPESPSLLSTVGQKILLAILYSLAAKALEYGGYSGRSRYSASRLWSFGAQGTLIVRKQYCLPPCSKTKETLLHCVLLQNEYGECYQCYVAFPFLPAALRKIKSCRCVVRWPVGDVFDAKVSMSHKLERLAALALAYTLSIDSAIHLGQQSSAGMSDRREKRELRASSEVFEVWSGVLLYRGCLAPMVLERREWRSGAEPCCSLILNAYAILSTLQMSRTLPMSSTTTCLVASRTTFTELVVPVVLAARAQPTPTSPLRTLVRSIVSVHVA